MTSREKSLQKGIIKILHQWVAPKKIILFGSRAKGNAHRGSDFDIAIDVRTPNPTKKRLLKDQIEDIAGLYRVDVVFLRQVSKSFRRVIEATGKILYER